MKANWHDHDGSAERPEQSKGLASLDVQFSGGAIGLQVSPSYVNWTRVKKWKRTDTIEETLAAIGLRASNPSAPAAPDPINHNDVQSTLNERGKTHGDFGVQAATSQLLKHALRCTTTFDRLAADQREALETLMMKVSRILNGNPDEPDHWRDIAGYATLVENRLVHGKSHLG